MKRTLFVVLTATVILFSQARQDNVPEAFIKNGIVPDVVPVPPPDLVKVSFPSSGKQAKLGNELTPTQVKDQPRVCWDTEPDALYTLMMVDPDAPSRVDPTEREWQHWVVINVPGSDVASGETITEFVSSAPPEDSGLHRYVFLVYKQCGKVKFDGPKLSNRNPNRGKFRAAKFAEKYQLGSPVAGNFYLAQYDDYVPQVQASLTETKK